MIDGMIHIKESDPPTNVSLTPTVPITCPPSEMTLDLFQSVGLDISDCSLHFTEPLASQTIQIAALKSSSSFSRVARIVFSPISSPGSPWHLYTPAFCPVCSRQQDFALSLQFTACELSSKTTEYSLISFIKNIKKFDF